MPKTKKPEPKETLTGQVINLDIYAEKDYKAMTMELKDLQQFKISQFVKELENRIWRLKKESARLKGFRSKIQVFKEIEYAKEGYKVVKDERD